MANCSYVIDDYTRIPLVLNGMKGFKRPTANFSSMPFPSSFMIPQTEWQARIQERQERKNGLHDLVLEKGLTVLDQGQTNYCWCNGVVYSVMCHILSNQNRIVRLSPASAAAQIKNYQNEGGWGDEALEFIETRGLATQDLWPPNAISRQYKTASTDQAMLDYRVPKWIDLEPRNHNQVVSLLLRNIPVAVGFNWWGHLVSAIDVEWKNGTAVIVIANSWGQGWGDKGYGILEGNRMLADGAVAPLSVINA